MSNKAATIRKTLLDITIIYFKSAHLSDFREVNGIFSLSIG